MKRFILLAAIMAACGALWAPARASYLEEDTAPAPVAPVEPEQIVVRPVPPPRPPVPDNPLTAMVGRLSVRPAYTHKGLTVYLLETSGPTDRTEYLSLTEALAERVLSVTEKGGGSVPLLLGRNRGRRPILMLAGEVLSGGRQNRVLREDVLLPARSGWVELPVFCVEHGRWSGRSKNFESSPSQAALNVRVKAQAQVSQAEIWDDVSAYQEGFSIETRTGDLQAVQDSEEVREAVKDYREGFAKCWRPRAVGMVVARHEWVGPTRRRHHVPHCRIVGADIFSSAEQFRKHRDRLLESYAVDCYVEWRRRPHEEGREMRLPVVPGVGEVERFLRLTYRAEYSWRAGAGRGRILQVGGSRLGGTALVLEGELLHACLFPAEAVRPRPVPMPRPRPMQQELRRQPPPEER